MLEGIGLGGRERERRELSLKLPPSARPPLLIYEQIDIAATPPLLIFSIDERSPKTWANGGSEKEKQNTELSCLPFS